VNKVRKLDRLRTNQSYEIYNLVKLDYNVEVVQRWMKYHWPYLEANHEHNEELHTVWIDLTSAIDQLDVEDQNMLTMYCEGYTLKEISALVNRSITGSLLQLRIKTVVRYLNGGELRED
jgi:DNA-directed RNA polymerase specialized sigma24 family protein